MTKPSIRRESFVVLRGAIPDHLEAGTLYVNPQGIRSHHLCACGCGHRVMIPLNDIEWELTGTDDRPSLDPSIGNWNLECKSHYILSKGRVRWDRRFSRSEIDAVRRRDLRPYQQTSWLHKVGQWIELSAKFFRRS